MNRLEIMPGISDNNTVFINANIEPQRQRPVKGKLYIWEKANCEKIREELNAYKENCRIDLNVNSAIQDIWDSFKKVCHKMIDVTMSQANYHPLDLISHGSIGQ